MSDLEARRRQTAIRTGHIVMGGSGKSYEVADSSPWSIGIKTETGVLSAPRRNLTLSPDQLTEEDEQGLAEHEQACRVKFTESLSPLFRTFTFDRLSVHAGNRAAVEACQRFEHGTTLFIHGDPGNGKTMLAVATAHRFVPHYTVAVWSIVDFFSALRTSFNPNTHAEHPNLKRPELLVLDDFGKTRANDFVYEKLYGLINHRLEYGLTTVFTSNRSVWDAAPKVSPDPDNLGAGGDGQPPRLGEDGRGERAGAAGVVRYALP